MATKILIPTPLRPFTDKLDAVEIDGSTIGELLKNQTTKYGGLKQHLYAGDGKLRSFVNVYVNDDDIRYLQKDQTPLKAGDTVSIIPSVAGGAPSTPAQDASLRASAPSASSTSTSSTSATCSARSFTARRTWAAPSSNRRRAA